MRHSDIGLTMNIYTDPIMLDIDAAENALPAFDGHEQSLAASTA